MSATGNAADGAGAVPASGGFTLIEALVVLAITGLVTGLLFPRLESLLDEQVFRTSINSVSLAISDQRAAAIRTGKTTEFTILPGGSGYSTGTDMVRSLPQGERLAGNRTKMRFYADGSSEGGSLTLADRRRAARITVDADTGSMVVAR